METEPDRDLYAQPDAEPAGYLGRVAAVRAIPISTDADCPGFADTISS